MIENQTNGVVKINKAPTFTEWMEGYTEDYKTLSIDVCLKKYEDFLKRNFPDVYKRLNKD